MTRQTRYIPTLDGWRALSVVGVVLFHGRNTFFGDHWPLLWLASRGYLGVDVFFATSGFLICGLLLQEYARDHKIDLNRFYIRRCFRILPPYYAALAFVFVFSIFGVIRGNSWEIPSCLLFYRNYMPLGIDEQGGFYTAHFWSLAVEEQFYLIWPMLLLALKPKRLANLAFLLTMLAFIWKVLAAHFHPVLDLLPASVNLLSHTDTLLWGCLAAIYFPAIQRWATRMRFTQLWLPILAILLVTQATHLPELVSLSAILLPALVLSTVLQPASWLGSVLEWQPLRWIGTLSYSIYLWQEFFLPYLASMTARGAFGYLQQPPWNVLAILMCACISRYLIEIPMIRLGHRLSAPGLGLVREATSIRGLSYIHRLRWSRTEGVPSVKRLNIE